jgi:hypothetical protein
VSEASSRFTLNLRLLNSYSLHGALLLLLLLQGSASCMVAPLHIAAARKNAALAALLLNAGGNVDIKVTRSPRDCSV